MCQLFFGSSGMTNKQERLPKWQALSIPTKNRNGIEPPIRIFITFVKNGHAMHVFREIRHFFWRIRLKNPSVSIISNNCWGGFMYRYCKLPYNSPFAGCFLFAPDYIRMLRSLKNYMSGEMHFISRAQSSYADHITKDYPIGVLTPNGTEKGTEPIEIHFLHYATPEAAVSAWQRRVQRIRYDNLLVKFCDRDLCTPELIAEFDRMEFPEKVCFTARPYPYKSVVVMKNFAGKESVSDEWLSSWRYYDFVKAANRLKK